MSAYGAGAYDENPYKVNYADFSVTVKSTGDEKWNLYQDKIDGIGVLKDENDEIDDFERILVEFNAAQLLDGVWITDLFDSPDGNNTTYGEMGRVNLFDIDNQFITGFDFYGRDAHQGNGEIYVDFDNLGVAVKKANFFVINEGDTGFKNVDDSKGNEFSIAGFNISTVPEPAAIILFGTCLVGLVGINRKKK